MPPSLPTSRRLCSALARLVAEEAAVVQAGEFTLLAGVQERIGAVSARLATLPVALLPAEDLRDLLTRRQATSRLLQTRGAAVRGELERLQHTQRRLHRLAPAYGGRMGSVGPRFTASA